MALTVENVNNDLASSLLRDVVRRVAEAAAYMIVALDEDNVPLNAPQRTTLIETLILHFDGAQAKMAADLFEFEPRLRELRLREAS